MFDVVSDVSSRRLPFRALLGVLPVLAAFGASCARGEGCGGALPPDREMDAGAQAEGGDAETTSCTTPIVIEVYIAGTYAFNSVEPPDLVPVDGPSLITRYSFPKGLSVQPNPRCTAAFALSHPFFAAPFSVAELCSAEETSPSYLRFACLGSGGRRMSIEYRVEGRRRLVITTDHPDKGRSVIEEGRYISPMPPDACVTLATEIPRRDLAPLQKAYLDDRPSAHCQPDSGARRKVPATFVRALLPKGHELYELGQHTCSDASNSRRRHGATSVRLALPPDIGPTQDLGILDQQCEMCFASLLREPNGALVGCGGGISTTTILAYQLGDHLYVVEEDHVRQVALPCGVSLDFRLKDFMAPLTRSSRDDD